MPRPTSLVRRVLSSKVLDLKVVATPFVMVMKTVEETTEISDRTFTTEYGYNKIGHNDDYTHNEEE
jgi:hypothetical protein